MICVIDGYWLSSAQDLGLFLLMYSFPSISTGGVMIPVLENFYIFQVLG
jgi:hypothetical protein